MDKAKLFNLRNKPRLNAKPGDVNWAWTWVWGLKLKWSIGQYTKDRSC